MTSHGHVHFRLWEHVNHMETDHVVQSGDCIESIAKRFGFFPDTIWEHANNSALRDLRKDPNILHEGDVVHVPQLTEKEESGANEKKHRFRRKGVPARLRMVFMRPKPPDEEAESGAAGSGNSDPSEYQEPVRQFEEEHEPIANAKFVIEIDGITTDGTSNAEGLVDVPIPPDAVKGKIRFFPGTEDEISYDLELGEMAPIETIIGVRKRLYNLSYRCPPSGDEMDPVLKDAIGRFQAEHDLEVTRESDQATQDKLKEVHGS